MDSAFSGVEQSLAILRYNSSLVSPQSKQRIGILYPISKGVATRWLHKATMNCREMGDAAVESRAISDIRKKWGYRALQNTATSEPHDC